MKKNLSSRVLLFVIMLFIGFSACKTNKPSELQLKYADKKAYWIPEVTELLKLDSVETYPDNSILFMGSSSIRLWKTLQDDMKPYSAIRRGYGGASYSDLIHFTEDIVQPHQLAGIAIFVANDIRAQPDDKKPEEVLALFKEVVRLSRKHHPTIPIFSIAVTPTPSRWKAWPEISKANNLIQHYCESTPNLYFIETQNEFLTAEQLPDSSLFVGDMLHQNPNGYAKWTQVIKHNLMKAIPVE